jgi:tetratricopeptide (TPR) repeat protein
MAWSVRMRRQFIKVCIVFALAVLTQAASTLAPAHAQTAEEIADLNNRAIEALQAGRYAEATTLGEQMVAASRTFYGEADVNYATGLNNLAEILRNQGRLVEASKLYNQALPIYKKTVGAEHEVYASALNNLGLLYHNQGRYAEAATELERALEIRRKHFDPISAEIGQSLNNLGEAYRLLGANAKAEQLLKQSLDVRLRAPGDNAIAVAQSYNNLGELYRWEGRPEAELFYNRAVTIVADALPPEHPFAGILLGNLGDMYREQGKFAEAERLTRGSLKNAELASGAGGLEAGRVRSRLGIITLQAGRAADAITELEQALTIERAWLGDEHPEVGQVLQNLAAAYLAANRFDDAEAAYRSGIRIMSQNLGPEHSFVTGAINNLSAVFVEQQRWNEALPVLQQAAALTVTRSRRGAGDLTGRNLSDAERAGSAFGIQVAVAYRVANAEPARATDLAAESFEQAQWATTTEASRSLALTAARQISGDGLLGRRIRERQDLVAEWKERDQVLNVQRALAPVRQQIPDAIDEQAYAARLSAIDAQLKAIDQSLAIAFPDYVALANPEPLAVTAVQAELHASEVLAFFLETPAFKALPAELYVWLVPKSGAPRWLKLALTPVALATEVAALRCGLDAEAWAGAGEQRCQQLTGSTLTRAAISRGQPLPFDLARAARLYVELFGKADDVLVDPDGHGRDLLVVPSPALSALPLQVLVTSPPAPGLKGTEAYRAAAWLARRHTVTILPAVNSLQSLRRLPPVVATQAFLGFGNPTLEGSRPVLNEKSLPARLRRAAAYRQTCALPKSADEQALEFGESATLELATANTPETAGSTLGATTSVDDIRRWDPVPATGRLLCEIADDIGSAEQDIWLGARATEAAVKELDHTGQLARFRFIQFATHGVIAGQVKGIDEPGLILTPPSVGSAGDDGYLAASEITALKLDADWVILSACNTASGGSSSGEACQAWRAHSSMLRPGRCSCHTGQ